MTTTIQPLRLSENACTARVQLSLHEFAIIAALESITLMSGMATVLACKYMYARAPVVGM